MGFLRRLVGLPAWLPTGHASGLLPSAPICRVLRSSPLSAFFGLVALRGRLSLGSPPISARSSEASVSSFPGSTYQRPARMGVSHLLAPYVFSDDDDGSSNFLRLPHAVRACFTMPSTPCHATPLRHAFCENTFSFTAIDVSALWSSSFGLLALVDTLRGPPHLSSLMVRASGRLSPIVLMVPGESFGVFWVEYLKYFLRTFLGLFGFVGISYPPSDRTTAKGI